jgi:uncharacterized protein YcgI (DUF1989 family)
MSENVFWDVQENLDHANFDPNFYNTLYENSTNIKLRKKIRIEPRAGKATLIKAGDTFRIVELEGAQIADLWLFNRQNPAEHFWSNYTMVLEGM